MGSLQWRQCLLQILLHPSLQDQRNSIAITNLFDDTSYATFNRVSIRGVRTSYSVWVFSIVTNPLRFIHGYVLGVRYTEMFVIEGSVVEASML